MSILLFLCMKTLNLVETFSDHQLQSFWYQIKSSYCFVWLKLKLFRIF